MSETDREMTLDEWMGRLPKSHYANKELAALRARLEAAEKENERLRGVAEEEEHPILGAMRSLTDGGLLVYRRPDGREGYHVVDLNAERLQAALDAAFPPRTALTPEVLHE